MTMAIPSDVALPVLAGAVFCVEKIKENATQTVRVDYMTCCIQDLDICIAQNADKTIQFQDSATVDYSSATEITFTVWENAKDGAEVLNKTLTGGDITLASPNIFQLDITNAESGAMTTTRKYCEAWVTLAGGEQRMVGAGFFEVKDTRKHD